METATGAKTRTEILISGFGGQGVIRMGQILGLAAIKQGHRVTMLKSHGTETRGGYVRAQLVISPEYVDSPVVEHADVFVAFSQPAYKKFYELCDGKVMYDPELVESVHDDAPERHVAVAATQLSKEKFSNQLFANMIMLAKSWFENFSFDSCVAATATWRSGASSWTLSTSSGSYITLPSQSS